MWSVSQLCNLHHEVAETRIAPLPSALERCGTHSNQLLYELPLGETTLFRLSLSKILQSRFSDANFPEFGDFYLIFQ